MNCGLLMALVVLAPATASASPVRLSITGDGCDLDGLESQLTTLTGSDPVAPTATPVVQIETHRATNGFEASIVFDDANGQLRGPRSVFAKTCSELLDSVSLIVAMALPALTKPEPAPVSPTPTSSPSSDPPLVPGADLMTIVAHAEPRDSSSSVETALYAAGAGGVTSQGAQAQLMIGIRWRRGSGSLTAELRADAPESHQVAVMGGVSVFRSQISVSPCLHVGALGACAVASVGTIHGSGEGLTDARSVYTPLVSGGIRLTWERPISEHVSFRLHLEGDALLTTTTFDVDNMPVWVSSRFEGAAGFGVLARFR